MLGATTATATATATTSTMSLLPIVTVESLSPSQEQTTDSHPKVSDKYTCRMCSMKFSESEEQRAHMRSAWHVCNLQRKLEGSYPLNEEEYREQYSPSPRSRDRLSSEQDWRRGYNEDGLKRYSVVRKSKRKTASVASSSSSSSHVKSSSEEEGEREEEGCPGCEWCLAANLSSGDDHLESLESGEGEEEEEEDDLENLDEATAARLATGSAMRLESGKIVGSKSSKREVDMEERRRRKLRDVQHTILQASSSPPSSSDDLILRQRNSPVLTEEYLSSFAGSIDPPVNKSREQQLQLSKRDAMGIVGLHETDRRALMATQKKMARLEVRVGDHFRAGVEARANCQKHYRIGGSRGGKKMGGLEKRLG